VELKVGGAEAQATGAGAETIRQLALPRELTGAAQRDHLRQAAPPVLAGHMALGTEALLPLGVAQGVGHEAGTRAAHDVGQLLLQWLTGHPLPGATCRADAGHIHTPSPLELGALCVRAAGQLQQVLRPASCRESGQQHQDPAVHHLHFNSLRWMHVSQLLGIKPLIGDRWKARLENVMSIDRSSD